MQNNDDVNNHHVKVTLTMWIAVPAGFWELGLPRLLVSSHWEQGLGAHLVPNEPAGTWPSTPSQ